ncbi:hypothetical protein ACLBYE_10345 [Methylobacterium sp. A52T]
MSRRNLIQGSAAAGASLLTQGTFGMAAQAAQDLPTLSYRLLRDTDLLNVEVRFINFRLASGSLLTPIGLGQSSIAVILPPQNLAEAIFDERHRDQAFENDPIAGLTADDIDHIPPVSTFISGPSWVVFEVPDRSAPFDLMHPDSWWPRVEQLSLRVVPGASGPWVPRMPTSRETALEVPFRLYISPGPDTRFSASRLPDEIEEAAPPKAPDAAGKAANAAPVAAKGAAGKAAGRRLPAELWNAVLTSRTLVIPAGLPPGTTNIPEELAPPKRVVLEARAVYSPDYQRRSEPRFTLYYPAERPLSLHALTRHRLVKQMSEGDGKIDIEHLVLTALGADASFRYASQKTVDQIIQEQVAADEMPGTAGETGTELRLWKHRIVIGRDVFFVEAFFGFLFPFCHPAIYVELTQRKFASYTEELRTSAQTQTYDPDRASAPGAYLLKRRFILVQDPLKSFAGSDSAVGRMMPTKRVTLRTMRSPDLADPMIEPDPGNPADRTGLYFWPRLESTDGIATWETEVEDESGQRATTTDARLWFASNIVKGHRRYAAKSPADRTIPFPSSKIAFAPEKGPSQLIAPKVEVALVALRTSPPKKVEDAVAAIREVVHAAAEELNSKTQKIADVARDVLMEFETKVAKGSASVAELLAAADRFAGDLAQRNDLGATLETRAITFTSNFVSHEIAIARRVLTRLGRIQTLDQIRLDLLEPLRNGTDPFDAFDRTARTRVADGLEALRDAGVGLKKIDTGIDALDAFRTKARAYLDEFERFADQAASLGSSVFHTGIDGATVVLPAIKGLLPEVPAREIRLVGDYVTSGFESLQRAVGTRFPNAQNGVFASLTEAVGKAEDIGGQIRNGLAKPSAVISGISREVGAVVADTVEKVKDVARTDFNHFKQDLSEAIPDAKLFGVIPLRKIVAEVSRGQLPNMNVVELPDKIVRTWTWAAPVKEQNLGILTFSPRLQPAGLYIRSVATISIPKPKELANGEKPSAVVELYAFLGHMKSAPGSTKVGNVPNDVGDMTPGAQKLKVLALNLLDLVEVEISELSVKAHFKAGEAPSNPTVTPVLAKTPVQFLGPLAFLGTLQKELSFGSLTVSVDADFVSARSNTALPQISFGAFSCRNLALKSGVALPLGDRPLRYEFAFSSFEKPFELSVMGFAGRGYFGAAFESNGNRELQGALEFGGALSFDVGVASGGLYVMAGGYLKINNSTTELAGYLRAGGNLDVLGLIHASVEFFLALAYRNGENESLLYGYCEITVSIDLLLYSQDVHIGMEKTIAGSRKEPQTAHIQQVIDLLSTRGDAMTSQAFVRAAARRYNSPMTQRRVPLYFMRPSMKQPKADPMPETGRFERKAWGEQYWSHLDFARP